MALSAPGQLLELLLKMLELTAGCGGGRGEASPGWQGQAPAAKSECPGYQDHAFLALHFATLPGSEGNSSTMEGLLTGLLAQALRVPHFKRLFFCGCETGAVPALEAAAAALSELPIAAFGSNIVKGERRTVGEGQWSFATKPGTFESPPFCLL